MPNLQITCRYCNAKYEVYVYGNDEMNKLKCKRCGDSDLKKEKVSASNNDVFGYEKDTK